MYKLQQNANRKRYIFIIYIETRDENIQFYVGPTSRHLIFILCIENISIR